MPGHLTNLDISTKGKGLLIVGAGGGGGGGGQCTILRRKTLH